jgi:hypothetical protein
MVPVVAVEPRSIVECDGDEPRIGVHGDEREPVAAVHPVAREVDPERRLRQLRRYLLRGQGHLPHLVRVPVQAQVLLLYTNPTPEPHQHVPRSNRRQKKKERSGGERRLGTHLDGTARRTPRRLRREMRVHG